MGEQWEKAASQTGKARRCRQAGAEAEAGCSQPWEGCKFSSCPCECLPALISETCFLAPSAHLVGSVCFGRSCLFCWLKAASRGCNASMRSLRGGFRAAREAAGPILAAGGQDESVRQQRLQTDESPKFFPARRALLELCVRTRETTRPQSRYVLTIDND